MTIKVTTLDEKIEMTCRLYRTMPGAPPVPSDDRGEQWDDIFGNQHWQFCEEIVSMIFNAYNV